MRGATEEEEKLGKECVSLSVCPSAVRLVECPSGKKRFANEYKTRQAGSGSGKGRQRKNKKTAIE